MPIYEYRCENGHTFEVMQRMADDPIAVCSTCGAPVQRILHPVAVHFKGSGFYTTDYGKRKGASANGAGGDGSESKSESKSSESKSSDSKSSDSKSSDSKSESKSGSKSS
jgi:putative FmdB family regulatory protein